MIFDEISLPDLSVAECSTKNANHSFQVKKKTVHSPITIIRYVECRGDTLVFYLSSIRSVFFSSCFSSFPIRFRVCVPAPAHEEGQRAISVPLHIYPWLQYIRIDLKERRKSGGKREKEKNASPNPKCSVRVLRSCLCVFASCINAV